jgi:hypothetical protein
MTGAAAAVKSGALETRLVCGIEVGKACNGGVELQFDGADRAVTLFADDDLGLAVNDCSQRHQAFKPRIEQYSLNLFCRS